MKKKAFITGVNGQDGSFLAEWLLAKNYEVHGLIRQEAFESLNYRLNYLTPILDSIYLHVGSADNQFLMSKLLSDIQPHECYHLAATSFVSYDLGAETSILQNNFNSTHYILASIRAHCPDCRFYFAGSSEMFGEAACSPQNEDTSFNPRSIYGISKMAGAVLSRNYRKQHGIFTCNGILYNHESSRRGFEFVTKKISSTVAKIVAGLAQEIELGNIHAQRDWGYAPEYVKAMWLMLNHDVPGDYVIATGTLHTVKDILECAFSSVNLDYKNYLKTNPVFHRAEEEVPLMGNYSKARAVLGWEPQKPIFEVIQEMVHNDIKNIKLLSCQ